MRYRTHRIGRYAVRSGHEHARHLLRTEPVALRRHLGAEAALRELPLTDVDHVGRDLEQYVADRAGERVVAGRSRMEVREEDRLRFAELGATARNGFPRVDERD